jgi:prepilin-type N-terminal cleavage/methylation domain-containing protein
MIRSKKGFTLFELIIVVVIIGVVYALVISNFSNDKRVKIAGLKEIKEAISPLWKRGKRVDLYIYDNCQKAVAFINYEIDESDKEITLNMEEFKELEVYKSDALEGIKRVEFNPILINSKSYDVCLQYTLFPNGSNSAYIVKSDGNYYIYHPIIEDVEVVDNLELAKERLLHEKYSKADMDEFK